MTEEVNLAHPSSIETKAILPVFNRGRESNVPAGRMRLCLGFEVAEKTSYNLNEILWGIRRIKSRRQRIQNLPSARHLKLESSSSRAHLEVPR